MDIPEPTDKKNIVDLGVSQRSCFNQVVKSVDFPTEEVSDR